VKAFDHEFCTRCDRPLNPGQEAWLEFDQRTQTYTKREVPEEESQGVFAFGEDCARRELAFDRDVWGEDQPPERRR
jgi:hypothetical protein